MRSYLGPALVSLAILQGVLIGRRFFDREPESAPYRVLSVGDTVVGLSVLPNDERGSSLNLVHADGRPTILLAFNATCPHCEAVAPIWRDWLQTPRSAHVLAITSDSLPSAYAYRARHDWNVELVSVAGAERYSPEHLLVSRVPWIAVIDSHGVLRLFEHGESLAKVDSLLASLSEGPI
jgi:peroxiredoxin